MDSPIVTHPAAPGPESSGEPSTTPAAGAGLVLYDKMRQAIEQCANVDEVKEVRSKATALALYRRQAGDREAEKKFAAIRIRAERRIGELLKEMGESGERDTGKGGDRKSRSVETTVKPKTLSDLGVSKDQSRKFQQLAAIPREKFERAIDPGEQVPTTAGVISASKTDPAPNASAPARAKPSREQSEAQEKAYDVWESLNYLEMTWEEDHDEEDLWDFAPRFFWPLLDSFEQDDLVRIAKALVPWLEGIIAQAKKTPAAIVVVEKPKLVKGDRAVQQ